ncbi:hypothetical protein [Streptomyces bugieae]|uniref:Type II secretion system protein GspF domain-containing protein n=1 Tax=Streptomyces bugieae TaxID=3098223 RepID=A0ABU7NRM8_9ACTN|nr:hypothetical protein [Streptomyces sp. DSM 41528]
MLEAYGHRLAIKLWAYYSLGALAVGLALIGIGVLEVSVSPPPGMPSELGWKNLIPFYGAVLNAEVIRVKFPWLSWLFIGIIAAWSTFWLIQFLPFRAATRQVWLSRIATIRLARRFALIMTVARAIGACAWAQDAVGEQQALAFRKVSRRLGAVNRAVLSAHKQRGSVPLFSLRRKVLKEHERNVVGALRKAELLLDSDPQSALRELGALLHKISERYCDARVGALLDAEELDEVQPAPDREALRLITLAILLVGASIVFPLVGVPDSVAPIVMAGFSLVLAALLWGRGARQALDVLGLFLGP